MSFLPRPLSIRSLLSAVSSLLTLVTAVPSLAAQERPIPSVAGVHAAVQNGAQASAPQPSAARPPLVYPLFLVDERFSSTLVMVNPVDASTYAEVFVRDAGGRDLARKRVSFAPHSRQSVEIGDLLREVNLSSARGSVVVRENPNLKSPVLAGALSMTYRADQGNVFLDEERAVLGAGSADTLRAVTGPLQGAPLVALASLSPVVQHVTVACTFSAGQGSSRTLTLPAGQTSLIKSCGEILPDNVTAGEGLGNSPSQDSGPMGIEISSDGKPGVLGAFAIGSGRGGSSIHSIDFASTSATNSATSIFPGLPIGSVPLLPNGAYAPQISVANFASVPRHVTVRLAASGNGSEELRTVKEISLPAHAVSSVLLAVGDGVQGIANSLIVSSDALPGEVVSRLASTAAGNLEREVKLPAKDDGDPQNGGNHPWSTEDGNQSTLLLFNRSEKLELFNVQVASDTARWEKAYTLKPLETKALSIAQLIADKIKDDYNRTIPGTLIEGHVSWSTLHEGAGRGRLLLTDASGTIARNYSCGSIRIICGAQLTGVSSFFGLGSNGAFGSISSESCETDKVGQCDGESAGPVSGTYSWSSSNTAVASMVSPTNTKNGSVSGAGIGTANITGAVSGPHGCSAGGTAPAKVVDIHINSANLSANTVSVTLSGDANASGSLQLVLNGTANAFQFVYGAGPVGPGTYLVSMNRAAIPKDIYSSITGTWNVSSSPAKTNVPIKWNVLGMIRHSQYNTPAENACLGGSTNAWIVDVNTCQFTPIALNAQFVSQTVLNGTGSSSSFGILKFTPGNRNGCAYPPGADDSNTFLQVNSVTGSCNRPLDTSSVATYPNPVTDVVTFGCNDNLNLVTAANANQALKFPEDYCPACVGQFNGTAGHVDDYSQNSSCQGHAVGDYGNFWTADTYNTN